MFYGMHNIFKVTAGYNSTYHHNMGWVVGGHLFSLKTLLYFVSTCDEKGKLQTFRSVRVAERLALPISDHGVVGLNPAGGEILPEPKRHFIAQSLSCSPFHRLEMTEILLKGRKTLTHPSIQCFRFSVFCL